MLCFPNATTPKTTIEAVLEYLDFEAATYRHDANRARTKRDAALDTARCNAIKNLRSRLADCDLMKVT